MAPLTLAVRFDASQLLSSTAWTLANLVRRLPRQPMWWAPLLALAVVSNLAAWWWAYQVKTSVDRQVTLTLKQIAVDSERRLSRSNAIQPSPDLTSFKQVLIAPEAVSNAMLEILDFAVKQELVVGSGTYTQRWDAEGKFGRHEANLQFTGSAGSLRHFIERMLKMQPALGIQSLQIERSGSNVSAQIGWVWLVRSPDLPSTERLQ